MKYEVGNAQDIGKREEQEDFFAFTNPNRHSFVSHGGYLGFVADGMGGMAFGSEASQWAVKNFLRSYDGKSYDEAIPDALNRALKQANRAVGALIKEKGMQPGAVGTTLSAVVLHNLDLYWISVGDSRIYLFRKGKLIQLNECHTVANELDRDAANGVITREQALKAPNRDALSSFLGMDHLPEVDYSRTAYRLHPDDRVIVCSDGLYNELSDEEIANTIIAGNLEETCKRLKDKALSKNNPYQDNITVIAMGPAGMETTVAETVMEKKSRPSRTLWILLAVLSFMMAVLLAVQLFTGGSSAPEIQEGGSGKSNPNNVSQASGENSDVKNEAAAAKREEKKDDNAVGSNHPENSKTKSNPEVETNKEKKTEAVKGKDKKSNSPNKTKDKTRKRNKRRR